MARKRQIYETAFDCKISKSQDDLENLNQMVNHALRISKGQNKSQLSCHSVLSPESSKQSQKNFEKKMQTKVLKKKPYSFRTIALCFQDQRLIDAKLEKIQDSRQITMRGPYGTGLIQIFPDKNVVESSPQTFYVDSSVSDVHFNSFLAKLDSTKRFSLNSKCILHKTGDKKCRQSHKCLHTSTYLPHVDVDELIFVNEKEEISEIKDRPKNVDHEKEKLMIKLNDRLMHLSSTQQNRKSCQKPPARCLSSKNQTKTECEDYSDEVETYHSSQEKSFDVKFKTSRQKNEYFGTKSIIFSSNNGSLESLHSSTSDENRSSSSNESRYSFSVGLNNSDNSSCYVSNLTRYFQNHQYSRFPSHRSPKLQILSPISDQSSQDPESKVLDHSCMCHSQKVSPEEKQFQLLVEKEQHVELKVQENGITHKEKSSPSKITTQGNCILQSKKSCNPPIQLFLAVPEIHGIENSISSESKLTLGYYSAEPTFQSKKQLNCPMNLDEALSDLPFDMPKLHRRKFYDSQDRAISGDMRNVSFTDMPKLNRQLNWSKKSFPSFLDSQSLEFQKNEDSSTVHDNRLRKSKLTLNLDGSQDSFNNLVKMKKIKKPAELSLQPFVSQYSIDPVDIGQPLERQGWYHGSINRTEAEAILRLLQEGSYLVRNSESTKQDYFLSLKSARGFMHMRIQKNEEINAYILGQFSKPFDSVLEMVQHFTINRLPIRGAEHMCLVHPVIAQLL